ncbi:MAG: hypothetical protein ACJAV1_002298 [Paraglaciecola sp.]|jgi:hypothetical protein
MYVITHHRKGTDTVAALSIANTVNKVNETQPNLACAHSFDLKSHPHHTNKTREHSAIKRRPKPYKLLMIPRFEARQDIMKDSHPRNMR